jgi:hypothetical protein
MLFNDIYSGIAVLYLFPTGTGEPVEHENAAFVVNMPAWLSVL